MKANTEKSINLYTDQMVKYSNMEWYMITYGAILIVFTLLSAMTKLVHRIKIMEDKISGIIKINNIILNLCNESTKINFQLTKITSTLIEMQTLHRVKNNKQVEDINTITTRLNNTKWLHTESEYHIRINKVSSNLILIDIALSPDVKETDPLGVIYTFIYTNNMLCYSNTESNQLNYKIRTAYNYLKNDIPFNNLMKNLTT